MQEYDVIHYDEALEAFVDGREVKQLDVLNAITGRMGSGKRSDADIPVKSMFLHISSHVII